MGGGGKGEFSSGVHGRFLEFFSGECKGREEENRITFFAKAALDKRTHVQKCTHVPHDLGLIYLGTNQICRFGKSRPKMVSHLKRKKLDFYLATLLKTLKVGELHT